MADVFTIRFTGRGARKFEKFLDSRHHMRILREEVKKATARNIAMIQDAIQRRINSKAFKKKNSPVTIAIKGSSIPLRDTGDLHNAIETELKDAFVGFVGVLKKQRGSHGMRMSMRDLIRHLEKGFVVDMTAAMRAKLWAMSRKSVGKSSGKSVGTGSRDIVGKLVIPGRPFITPVFRSKRLRRKLNRNWENAVKRALTRLEAL